MNYTCPKGHAKNIEQSYQVHIWLPVNLKTGETDHEADFESTQVDWESQRAEGYYFCPTCDDTFKELQGNQ